MFFFKQYILYIWKSRPEDYAPSPTIYILNLQESTSFNNSFLQNYYLDGNVYYKGSILNNMINQTIHDQCLHLKETKSISQFISTQLIYLADNQNPCR